MRDCKCSNINNMQKAKPKILTILQGQAGVHRVAAELMLRGYHVCFPAADVHGVDLMLESGIKIQVKTANLGFYKRTPYGAYWFQFGRTVFASATGKLRKEKRNYSSQCDFVILYGIDEGKFWVVPATAFDNANGLVLGREPQYRALPSAEIRERLQAGETQASLAKELGVSAATILRRSRGEFMAPKRTSADVTRSCADAWHLITELEQSRQPQGKLIEMPMVEAKAS